MNSKYKLLSEGRQKDLNKSQLKPPPISAHAAPDQISR